MNEVKYCEDCKHSVQSNGGKVLRCGHRGSSDVFALVYKRPDPETLPFCVSSRGTFSWCGKAGVLFEQKPPVTPRQSPRKWWKIWG